MLHNKSFQMKWTWQIINWQAFEQVSSQTHAHINARTHQIQKFSYHQAYLAALNTTTTINIIVSFPTVWTEFCFECNISRAAYARSRFDFDEYEPAILMISSVYFQSFRIMTLASIPLIYRSIFHNFFFIIYYYI